MAGDGSLLTMTGPLGPDARPIGLRASEAISEPFLFRVEIALPTQSVDPDTVLTQPMCLTVFAGSGTPRYFHGLVRSFHAGGAGPRGEWRYTAELVPAFWFATQTMDCRVFLTKSVADILTTLFTENNVKNRLAIQGARAPRPHTVQFNETDFDFACRLMQEEGYFYIFEHAEDGHTMVVADSNQAFADSYDGTLSVVPNGRNHDVLHDWRREVATAHGLWRLLDYDPLNPGTPVDGTQPTMLATAGASGRDMLRWPALEFASGGARDRARLHQEAAEAGAALYAGAGSAPELVPGLIVTIDDCPLSGASAAKYVVRSVEHAATDESETGGGAVWSYGNTLTAFPQATPWRERRTLERPVMSGLHMAIVLTADGEEIGTDAYGRVKVRLMWDHRGDATSDTTIWARVLQPWASNTWGWQHIPRTGDEVAVAFVDGDPDRPIVVGSLYNANKMPVFPLPDQKTKSGLRTRSSLKGGTGDFSEFSFDDKKGEEVVFLHAQKDHKLEVENDETWHVMNDQKVTVDNDRTRLTKGAESVEIGKSMTVKIGDGRTTEVTKGDHALTVKQGDITMEATMGAVTHKAMRTYAITSDTDSVKITATKSIELVVGGNSIKIEPAGITVKGMMVKLDGSMMTEVKSGMMTTVKGGVMTTVKGAIMMLN